MSVAGNLTNESVMLVEAIAPIDTTGAAQTGNMISCKNAQHVTIVINSGAWAGGTAAVTVEQATDVTDSAGTSKAVAFSYMYTNDGAATASALTKTTVTSNTFNVDTANSMYVIEIPVDTLDVDGGYDCLQVLTASPGGNADLIQATYIMSGTRHLGDNVPLSN